MSFVVRQNLCCYFDDLKMCVCFLLFRCPYRTRFRLMLRLRHFHLLPNMKHLGCLYMLQSCSQRLVRLIRFEALFIRVDMSENFGKYWIIDSLFRCLSWWFCKRFRWDCMWYFQGLGWFLRCQCCSGFRVVGRCLFLLLHLHLPVWVVLNYCHPN